MLFRSLLLSLHPRLEGRGVVVSASHLYIQAQAYCPFLLERRPFLGCRRFWLEALNFHQLTHYKRLYPWRSTPQKAIFPLFFAKQESSFLPRRTKVIHHVWIGSSSRFSHLFSRRFFGWSERFWLPKAFGAFLLPNRLHFLAFFLGLVIQIGRAHV